MPVNDVIYDPQISESTTSPSIIAVNTSPMKWKQSASQPPPPSLPSIWGWEGPMEVVEGSVKGTRTPPKQDCKSFLRPPLQLGLQASAHK